MNRITKTMIDGRCETLNIVTHNPTLRKDSTGEDSKGHFRIGGESGYTCLIQQTGGSTSKIVYSGSKREVGEYIGAMITGIMYYKDSPKL